MRRARGGRSTRTALRRRVAVCAALLALVCATASCSAGDAGPPGRVASGGAAGGDDVVEVFTLYRGRDADAFRATLDAFTEATGVATRHVGTAAFAARLRERVRDGDPPDVALFPQPALLRRYVRDGRLVPVDAPAAAADTVVPGVGDVGVVDGARYGVWFRLVVKSLVWYPPDAFRAAGHAPPATLAGLDALTRRIEADGRTPWCLGMESFGATGWVGTDWVEDLVLRAEGPEAYDRWAAGDVPFTDPAIARQFRAFGRVALPEGRVLGGRRAVLSTPALDAVLPMLDDPPGCLLSRQGSFQRSALPDDVVIGPDGDIDVFALPSVDGGPAPLVVGGEIAAAFSGRPGPLALLRHLAGPAAGAAWAARGGFVSPHTTFDPGRYADPFDRRMARLVADAEVVRFDASDLMPPRVGSGTFWDGVVGYVSGRPLASALETIQAGYEAADPDQPPP